MLTRAILLGVGELTQRLSSAFKLLLRVFSLRPVGRYGSYLGGGLRPNSAGYLVRDDRPHVTTSARTAVAPPLGLTSRSAHYRLGSSRPRGAALR